MSFYGTIDKAYALLFGEHMHPSSFDPETYKVLDFPSGDPRVTWTVEQPLMLKRGGVLRTMLDGSTRTIGMMSDLWTFALWDDNAYAWVLSQTDGLYDVECTFLTYDSINPLLTLPIMWGTVHVPHPNELVRLENNNRYFVRPSFRFYDCDYAEF